MVCVDESTTLVPLNIHLVEILASFAAPLVMTETYIVSRAPNAVVELEIFWSDPTLFPTWMSLTLIGVVSTDTVAVCVPAAVVSTTAPSLFFLLQATSATEKTTAPTSAAARLVVRIELSPLGGNGELQARMNQIGIRNLVRVGRVDLLPLSGVAVELPGDLDEAIAFLDGVRLRPAGNGRRSTGLDVGEIC